jgi:protein involved in polysaccharide export with SLBB domain
VLDLRYMRLLLDVSETREYSIRFGRRRDGMQIHRAGEIVFLLLITLLPVALNAQLPSQGVNLSGMQSANSVDCTDPLQSGTAQCVDQINGNGYAQNSTNINSTGILSPNGSNNPAYNDTENLSQQQRNPNLMQQQKSAPEPLTEFQKFIVSTTGQILPIYGASLFSAVPSTFSPLELTPVPPDYVIGPGDELRVRVWGQVSFQSNLRVDRSGDIFLQQVGPVHVAGIPFSALDEHLRAAVGRVYRNFDLTADLGQIRSIQVYVSGQARRPGVYTVSSLSTLVDALFASGGPSLQGSIRHIQLRRGSELVTDFDLYDLLSHGDKSKDVKLQSGDVIFIPPAGAQVAVAGSVHNPAIFELRDGESLDTVLTDAGGASSVAAQTRVSIERVDEHRDRHAMEVAFDTSGLATALADGDLVRVFSIVPVYRKTVILRGNTATPGRFSWHPGMHITDLIPDKESLITRDYWWKRAQLGLPAPEFEPIPGLDNLRQPAENRAITIKVTPPDTQAQSSLQGNLVDQTGNGQGQIQPQNGGQQGTAQGQDIYVPGGFQAQPGNQSGGYPYQNNYSQNPNLNAQQRPGSATLAGAQAGAASHSVPGSQHTEVRNLAPEIDWDYAVIERLDTETLKTNLIPFDLGKLVLQHDASQDLELQANDVVTIFSDADIRVPLAHQTKTVTLDGEFVHAGAYTVQPGESLRDLVRRAGGLTPNAYLYGSEFTRESTRAMQQARIDEYVQSLGMEIQRGSLALAASATSSAQDLASGASAQASEQSLLANLRQIRATGRIVLRFTPASSGLNPVPAISLEDGDRFAVPPVPATVNVVGAVYDQNSFLYQQGGTAGVYLRMAGGPNRDADQRHEFVIRSDGEVVSRDRVKGLWGNEFNNLSIYPGDTIMIPEKTFRASALRGVLDWSQLFSQFALGAAALSVLK